ncbi:tetratricopeptide repeat protein [Kriegella sp. EG-1]|nr:tetratricopeptide repeat protein [Flavobacteriaceae bacterium EG-1]
MKNIRFYLIIIFFLHFSHWALGQDLRKTDNANIDSLLQLIPIQKDSVLVDTYFTLFSQYIWKNPEKGGPYLDAAAPIIERLNSPYLKAELALKRGFYQEELGNFISALAYFEKAKVVFTELGEQKKLMAAYNGIGIVFKNLGQTGAALESYLTAIKLSESMGYSEQKRAPMLMNIGLLYSKLGNLEVSNDYYLKVEAICLKLDLKYGLAITQSNRATNLAKANKFREALDLYQGALPYFEQNNRKSAIGEQLNLIGAVYLKMDSLQKAKDYFLRAMDLNTEIKQQSELGISYRNLGDVAFQEKKYKAALEHYQNSLGIAKELVNNIEIVEDYLKISNTHERLGNIPKAFEYRKTYSVMHDSIFSQENNQKISALELRYKTEKSEQEIELQKKEIALLEEKEKAANLQRIGLIAGLLTTIVLSGLIYYGIRQKMKRNRLESERVQSELAFKKKELTTHALHLAKKNEVLQGLKQKAAELKQTESGGKAYQELIKTINFDQQDDRVWENFTRYFEAVHKDFEKEAISMFPDITKNELRLMALIKMNLSSKEIANILNISAVGVKKARNRLRKKMQLAPEDSLESKILSI